MAVAHWWQLDPDVVGRWDMVDFIDREEYMLIQIYRPQQDDEPKFWEGPGK